MISCIKLSSFTPQEVYSVFIHNQCLDFELISPEYLNSDVIWHILPDQKVDTNAMTSTSFRVNEIKYDSMTALIYNLQRKGFESNTQDTSTNIQLLIVWKPTTSDWFFTRALLIENSHPIAWDKLCSMHLTLLRDDDIVKNLYLLDNTIVLMATPRKTGLSRITKITISKDSEDNFMISLSLK
jgi:hypothetical protein